MMMVVGAANGGIRILLLAVGFDASLFGGGFAMVRMLSSECVFTTA
jgi:hypothetical protein